MSMSTCKIIIPNDDQQTVMDYHIVIDYKVAYPVEVRA